MAGPLEGFKVLEMAGLGPAPFCAMMLADMGAQIIRVDRPVSGKQAPGTIIDRGRRSVCLDLKRPEAIEAVLKLVEGVDAVIEGFRPGVMERMGLGPDVCLARNPKLVYGRMTGWGQTGPLAQAAGHDLNYIAITGALHAMGHRDRPPMPPLHLVGDMGGGGMMLAFGLVCALLECQRSGRGQVIDAAICDGVSTLATAYHMWLAAGRWTHEREANFLDGGAHYYGCYACADGKFVSVGPVEPKFYQTLLELCGIEDPDFARQNDRGKWPELREKLAKVMATRTRQEWCDILEGTDACFAPVLDFEEAVGHPHNVERQAFIKTSGVTHPAPAPRFSRTPGEAGKITEMGADTRAVLAEYGVASAVVDALLGGTATEQKG